MTLNLILMRHAKSGWDDPSLDDFDRPLNGRGRKAAKAIGAWLAETGHLPDVVLVSGAKRTVDTWARMAGSLPETATMRSEPALYLANQKVILGVLKAQTAANLMLIGHNPGIAVFANGIVAKASDHQRFTDFPTGATAVISFEAKTWAEIDWASGTLQDFIIPRELAE